MSRTKRGPWRGGASAAATANAGDPAKPRLTTSAMIASLAAEGQRTKPAPFGHALVELAKARPEIVGMTADLSKYTDLHIFAKEFPDRFYQMGMAEQLLMLAAGGMAHEGFVPFVTTYAVFASRRTYDFISQGIAEEGLNVKICCALPGLTTGYGPSHQATEDIAIFRGMPDLTIVDPCDALDTEQATRAIAAHDGPVYMRLLRGNVPLVLDEYDYEFELGKAKLIRDGADALVVSSGFMTMRALEAAKLLEADRVNLAVLHVPTIKPLGRGDDPARGAPQRAAGDRGGKPHPHRRPGRGDRRGAAAQRRHAASSGRWRCRTSSWTPAPCRPCTIATDLGQRHGHQHQGLALAPARRKYPGRAAGTRHQRRSGRHRMTMQLTRRHVLAGTASVLAAPADLAAPCHGGHDPHPRPWRGSGQSAHARGRGLRQAGKREDGRPRDGEHRRLGAARQRCRHVDQPAHGALDITANSQGAASGLVPELATLGLPFLFQGSAAAFKVLDGPIGTELADKFAGVGIVPLGWWDNGIRHITNSKKPINTPADLQGLTIRTPADPMTIDIFQTLGAATEQIAFSELYVALQQGVVDGQENPLANIASSKIYEVNKFISLSGHKWECNPFLISQIAVARLGADLEPVQAAANEATTLQRRLAQEADAKYLAEFKANSELAVNEVDRAAFQAATAPVAEKWSADYGDFVAQLLAAAKT